MPLPSDRKGLLLLAEKTTSLLASMPPPTGTSEDSRRYALELMRLGDIRLGLGELQEAERLYDEAVVAFATLDSAHDRELAAGARFAQVRLAATDGRIHEALEMIERMIELDADFSLLRWVPRIWASALGLWLMLLEQVGDDARLYEASGSVLELLEPAGPTIPLAVSSALLLRAQSAEHLGRKEEAVAVYERAITQLQGDELSTARDDYLNRAMLRVAVLLRDLDRAEEASDAMARLEQFKGKRPFSRAMRTIGRLWARSVDWD